MDPNFSNEFIGRFAYYAIYNNLVKYAPDFSLTPELAKSWDVSPDGKAITFHLEEGVKFQDGTDFGAEAVKWNFEYLTDPKTESKLRSTLANDVTSVEVVDKNTVIYHLNNPFRPLLSFLGERSGFMLSPAAVQKWGGGRDGDYAKNPSGTGAFKLSAWVPELKFVLERNDNYWEGGKPYLDRISFLPASDNSVRLAMIRTGEADIMDGVRSQDRPILERNPDVKVVEHEGGRYRGLRLSVDTEPWSNMALRHAIGFAIDRQALVDSYYAGAGRPAFSPEGAGWAYNPDIKILYYDPQKAREKLIEAGYPNGITFNYWCSSTASSIQLCETIQAMLAEVDINVDIVLVPASDYFRKQVARETHFNNTSFAPRADPHGRLHRVYYSTGASNVTGYNNPELDRLLDEAATIYDVAKAKELYDQIQRIIVEDATKVYTIHANEYAALSSKVQNFAWIPDLILRFRDLWLEQ